MRAAKRDRPNFLVIMSDEHGPMFSSTWGHPLVRTPNMDRLAQMGVTFDAAYCNSPLCVPSRLSFLTGRYVHHCRAWDNSVPLPVDAVTWPYLLRSLGYDAVLSGKMHLVGPDPLHGFRAQLATDLHAQLVHPIYPWRDGIPTAKEPWPSVMQAGAGTTREIEVDDEVERAALAYLRDPQRRRQPFALCVGFIAPHFPFVVPEPYFSMYYPHKVDPPNLPPGHLEDLPPSAKRLRQAFGLAGPYTEEQVLKARAAYYGLVTYLDDKIGRLLDTLEAQGLAESTVVIYTSDHGEMLGEHGLWRKMSFYEQSARVPLQVAWPGVIPGGVRVPAAVSMVDLVATMMDMVGMGEELRRFWGMDGDSFLALLLGGPMVWKDEAFVEHLAHGTDRAMAMLRQGRWKLCYGHGTPPELELYDLESDPGEFHNLANEANYSKVRERMLARLLEHWDPKEITREVMASQEARILIRMAHGDAPPF